MKKVEYINSENFDKELKEIIDSENGKKVGGARCSIDDIHISKKSKFVINFIQSLSSISGVTFKVLFWETQEVIESFFRETFPNKSYKMAISYGGGQEPGVFFVDDNTPDTIFIKELLDHHFNFELAADPALNLRVFIAINQDNLTWLLEIYDDRGFYMYQLERK